MTSTKSNWRARDNPVMLRNLPGSGPAKHWRQSHPMLATEAISAASRLGVGSDRRR
jgi:hypothetical protein